MRNLLQTTAIPVPREVPRLRWPERRFPTSHLWRRRNIPVHRRQGCAMFPFPFFVGKLVEPGSTSYTTPGTWTFIVPEYNSLNVKGWGGGGGGGGLYSSMGTGNAQGPGGAGGQSSFGALTARGGSGGWGGSYGSGGAGGTASNGSVNTTGGAGEGGGDNYGGRGGNAPGGGGAGGARQTAYASGTAGNAPGGGGGGAGTDDGTGGAGGGGSGGYAERTYVSGELTPGSTVTVVVGAAGTIGPGVLKGGAGAAGRVTISWS